MMRRLPVLVLALGLSGCGGCVNDEAAKPGATSGPSNEGSRGPRIHMMPRWSQLARLVDGGPPAPAPPPASEPGAGASSAGGPAPSPAAPGGG